MTRAPRARFTTLGLLLVAGACSSSTGNPTATGGTSGQLGDGGDSGGALCVGSIGGAAGADLSCVLATPAIPSPDAGSSDPVQVAAEADSLAALDLLFGRYLRGEVPVYRGTLSADDNESVLGNGPPLWVDKAIAPGSALASLVIGEDQAVLEVFSLCQPRRLSFQQSRSSPGVTGASVILDDNEGGGLGATCSGCAPDFFAAPSTIAWQALDASDPANGQPFHVVSSVSLGRVSPCRLTWDQLLDLNRATSAPAGFVKVGGEMVSHTTGRVQTVAPQPHTCIGQYVPYTIDLHVSLSNLADYGVRNFVAGQAQPICAP